MKKIISLFLVVMLSIILCSCGDSEKTQGKIYDYKKATGEFRVGFGRSLIMTSESVPLAGLGNTSTRMSTGYFDPIYTNAIVYADEKGETVISAILDLGKVPNEDAQTIRSYISTVTGVPQKNIFVSATHTHNAPDLTNHAEATILRYAMKLPSMVCEAVKDAIKDLKPAIPYIGSTEVQGLNFVRHYLCKDGTYAGDNFGSYSSGIVGHETEADHEMQFIRFKREGAKDILLTNWQAHPTMNCGSMEYDISADYVGMFRDSVEEQLDCNVIHFQGAAGNINPRSQIESETCTKDYREYGKQLAKYIVDNYDNVKKVDTGDIKVTSKKLTIDVDHTEDKLVGLAKVVCELRTSTGDDAKANEQARAFGMRSLYHANGIVTKAASPKTVNLEFCAFKIGDISFATCPNEMFDTQGMFIKDNAPYKMNIIMECTNGHEGYLPSLVACENHCYEKDTSRYANGTAEKIAEELVGMLKGIK